MEELPVFLKISLVVAAAASLAAAPASAATALDVRCFMLSNLFASKGDNENGRRLAQASGFYYLGKIQGMSDADLRRHIAEQGKQITAGTASAQMKECAAGVQASGQRIQSFAPKPQAAAPAPQRK